MMWLGWDRAGEGEGGEWVGIGQGWRESELGYDRVREGVNWDETGMERESVGGGGSVGQGVS